MTFPTPVYSTIVEANGKTKKYNFKAAEDEVAVVTYVDANGKVYIQSTKSGVAISLAKGTLAPEVDKAVKSFEYDGSKLTALTQGDAAEVTPLNPAFSNALTNYNNALLTLTDVECTYNSELKIGSISKAGYTTKSNQLGLWFGNYDFKPNMTYDITGIVSDGKLMLRDEGDVVEKGYMPEIESAVTEIYVGALLDDEEIGELKIKVTNNVTPQNVSLTSSTWQKPVKNADGTPKLDGEGHEMYDTVALFTDFEEITDAVLAAMLTDEGATIRFKYVPADVEAAGSYSITLAYNGKTQPCFTAATKVNTINPSVKFRGKEQALGYYEALTATTIRNFAEGSNDTFTVTVEGTKLFKNNGLTLEGEGLTINPTSVAASNGEAVQSIRVKINTTEAEKSADVITRTLTLKSEYAADAVLTITARRPAFEEITAQEMSELNTDDYRRISEPIYVSAISNGVAYAQTETVGIVFGAEQFADLNLLPVGKWVKNVPFRRYTKNGTAYVTPMYSGKLDKKEEFVIVEKDAPKPIVIEDGANAEALDYMLVAVKNVSIFNPNNARVFGSNRFQILDEETGNAKGNLMVRAIGNMISTSVDPYSFNITGVMNYNATQGASIMIRTADDLEIVTEEAADIASLATLKPHTYVVKNAYLTAATDATAYLQDDAAAIKATTKAAGLKPAKLTDVMIDVRNGENAKSYTYIGHKESSDGQPEAVIVKYDATAEELSAFEGKSLLSLRMSSL